MIQREIPGCFVHVIMGQLVMHSVWTQVLHQNSALIFNLALSGMERVVVTTVPYQIHHHDSGEHPPQETPVPVEEPAVV